MRRVVLLMAAAAALSSPAMAAQGDPRTVQGVIAWTPGPGGAPFVVVRTDDGRAIYADLSRARTAPRLIGAGTRIAIAGVEGANPYEVIAADVSIAAASAPQSLQPPAAGASPAPGTALGPQPAAPPSGAATIPAETERPPDRLDGKVRSVSGKRVVLRTTGGHDVRVDMPAGDITTVLHPGDDITVFGHRDGERFVATGFIRVEPAGSALPRQSPASPPPRQSR